VKRRRLGSLDALCAFFEATRLAVTSQEGLLRQARPKRRSPSKRLRQTKLAKLRRRLKYERWAAGEGLQ